MFMEDNTRVFAKWEKNHQEGTLVDGVKNRNLLAGREKNSAANVMR
jgi:hypothetical protein